MPIYCLRCECGWKGSFQMTGSEREGCLCPECESPAETDWSEQGPPSTCRNNAWEGETAKSSAMGVNPDQVLEAKKRTPSWEFDARGDAVFTSAEHQARCFREERAARALEVEELQSEVAAVRAKREAGDFQSETADVRTDLGPVDEISV